MHASTMKRFVIFVGLLMRVQCCFTDNLHMVQTEVKGLKPTCFVGTVRVKDRYTAQNAKSLQTNM